MLTALLWLAATSPTEAHLMSMTSWCKVVFSPEHVDPVRRATKGVQLLTTDG